MKKRILALLLVLSLSLSMVPIIYAAKSVNELREELKQNQENVEKTKKELKVISSTKNENLLS